jgi:hypothetical protein
MMPPLCLAQDLPKITISVRDYANVSKEILGKAEEEARLVFQEAGIQTIWLNCPQKLERIGPVGCHLGNTTTYLVLNVLPKILPNDGRIDGFGMALLNEKGTGNYAYIFYDRVQQLAESRKLGCALLAAVLVHEIGHLLLGSNAHSMSGIMCPYWKEQELKRISQGGMFFAPSQHRIMRNRIGFAPTGRDLPPRN